MSNNRLNPIRIMTEDQVIELCDFRADKKKVIDYLSSLGYHDPANPFQTLININNSNEIKIAELMEQIKDLQDQLDIVNSWHEDL